MELLPKTLKLAHDSDDAVLENERRVGNRTAKLHCGLGRRRGSGDLRIALGMTN